MTIVWDKPALTNMKQMFGLSFKITLDKIVPIQLDLDERDLQTKSVPNLPQSIGSKAIASSPHEFYLNIVFWFVLIVFSQKKKKSSVIT